MPPQPTPQDVGRLLDNTMVGDESRVRGLQASDAAGLPRIAVSASRASSCACWPGYAGAPHLESAHWVASAPSGWRGARDVGTGGDAEHQAKHAEVAGPTCSGPVSATGSGCGSVPALKRCRRLTRRPFDLVYHRRRKRTPPIRPVAIRLGDPAQSLWWTTLFVMARWWLRIPTTPGLRRCTRRCG